MKISDLKPRIIAVYAGRFHPFHIGHATAYHELADKFGADNTYIVTSGKVEPEKSPFDFAEKMSMMVAAGIPESRIFQEVSPYKPMNLPNKLGLDPNKDVLVFGVGRKDMAENPRFAFKPLKDGTAPYFQLYIESGKELRPFNGDKNADGTRAGHGYVYPVRDVKFEILGKVVNNASKIRELYKNANDETRLAILADLYPQSGSAIKKLKRIFDGRLA